MPSFLSKVFGRKKDDKESPRSQGRASDSSLLEGKFESVSPSATKFPEVPNGKGNGHGKEKEKDGFALFRAKSRPASPDVVEKRVDVPQLSLNLPGPKEDPTSRALGVVFEGDPDAQIILGDSALGSRRLNPLETLALVRACSQAITARGLETLGIMHPHWYSASPDIQRRLISLFIQSLAPKSPITTLAPTPTAFVSAFESEISSTRSPHDVAAVLRWGLRHLKLEGNTFGKEEGWYNNFFEAERTAEYPPNAFSTHLPAQLPAAHLELLTATLEILSALAARAETNGISGSKLSKFFGLWLLTSTRVEENDDWSTFYARWERSGRMLEHLFLSRIRDEAARSRMPTRLLELVHQYPYSQSNSPSSDTGILSRPRFSTRRYDALFVQIETELSATARQPRHHPLRLIAEAFKATSAEGTSNADLWEVIKKVGTEQGGDSPGAYPGLSRIFADETIRFLSLIPLENNGSEPTSPTFSLFVPQQSFGASRRRSFSMNDGEKAAADAATTAGTSVSPTSRHTKPATEPTSLPSASPTDWTEFSTTGFFEDSSAAKPLALTLLEKEKDMEVTLPRPTKRTKVSPVSFTSTRKSLDTPRSAVIQETPIEETKISKTTQVSVTQLDEAFIDFWSDALLDPISSEWPAFIICKLKSNLSGVEHDGKKLDWLVVEQSYKRPPPPTTPQDNSSAESSRRPRASSPRPSFKSDTTNSTRKRFSFFTSRNSMSSLEKSTKGRKKAGNSPRVGEMGEVLAEEDEKVETVKLRVPSPKPRKSMDTPKKSVDIPRKSVENGKVNGVEGHDLMAAAAVVGAAAVGGTAAAVVASSPEVAKADPTPATAVESKPEVSVPVPVEAEAAASLPVPTKANDEGANGHGPESNLPGIQNGHTHVEEAQVVADAPPAELPSALVSQTEAPARVASPVEPEVVREPTPEPKQELEAEVVDTTQVVEPTPAPVSEAEVPASSTLPEESATAPKPTAEIKEPEVEATEDTSVPEPTSAPIPETEVPTSVISPEELEVARERTPELPVPAAVPPTSTAEVSTGDHVPTVDDAPVQEELVSAEATDDAHVPSSVEDVHPETDAPIATEPAVESEAEVSQEEALVEPEVVATEEAVTPAQESVEVPVTAEDSLASVEPSEHAIPDEPVIEPELVEESVVHTEPLREPENPAADHDVTLPPVPIVEAELTPKNVEPVTLPVDESLEISPAEPTAPLPAVDDTQELPPAPESVVAAGDTPGPQIALDTSEPAALASKIDEHTQDAPMEADETHPDEATLSVPESSSETLTPADTSISGNPSTPTATN